MQTYTNGHRPAIITIPAIERPDPRADLDAYEDAIGELDAALATAAAARLAIERHHRALEARMPPALWLPTHG